MVFASALKNVRFVPAAGGDFMKISSRSRVFAFYLIQRYVCGWLVQVWRRPFVGPSLFRFNALGPCNVAFQKGCHEIMARVCVFWGSKKVCTHNAVQNWRLSGLVGKKTDYLH